MTTLNLFNMLITPPSGTKAIQAQTKRRWINPKGRLSQKAWGWLVVVAAVPLIISMLKLAGVAGPLGAVTLEGLPPSLTGRLGHLLIIPIGALIVVVFRMTLGLRTLGPFRAILLAIALEMVGFGLGIAFFALVTAAIIGLRPVTKKLGLPYYGRVLTMLGFVSGMIVMAIMIADAVGAIHLLEQVAYFPIVVLMLTGDAVARILDRDGPLVASWRVGATVAAAMLIAMVGSIPAIMNVLIRHPELIPLQIVSVVVICELFDLRLLERWAPVGRSGGAASKLLLDESDGDEPIVVAAPESLQAPATAAICEVQVVDSTPKAEISEPTLDGPLRIALVRNRDSKGVIGERGTRNQEPYSRKAVQRVLDGLREAGHQAKVFQGDMSLLPGLKKYMPVDPETGQVRGLVFNLAYGVQGDCRYTHVPAMLEMAGVPYTGANPLGHGVCLDKVIAKTVMQQAGIATPDFAVLSSPGQSIGSLKYPLIVKPRNESSSFGLRLVNNRAELDEAVAFINEQHNQEALVESFIAGREMAIGTLGNHPVRTLPIVEIDFGGRECTIQTHDDKWHASEHEPVKVCPAPLDAEMERKLREIAVRAVHACGSLDHARVDIRIDHAGTPYVLEINSMPSLGWGGSYVLSARHAGYSFSELLNEIVVAACKRTAVDISVNEPVRAVVRPRKSMLVAAAG